MTSRPRSTVARAATLLAGLAMLAGCASAATSSTMGSGANPQSAAAMDNPNLDTGSSLGGIKAPDFRLTNQFGQQMSLSQLHGRVVLLAFDDSECTTVCPLTTQSMVWARQLLGPAGSGVALLGIDANPQATSVADVMAYSRAHGMTNQWDFLTGTPAQLKTVWQDYKIAVQVEKGQIDHTPALFIIDQQGREQKVYLTQMAYSSVGQSAQILAGELAALLPGHPHVKDQQSLATIKVQGPAQQVTLPSALAPSALAPSAPSATLGPGKARLVMFFATWLSETSDLTANLQLGNTYTQYAAAHGLPALAAVDETATEPSAAAVRSYLAPLDLKYPVGLDTTGRVADGYGVQDQPWFALVNPAGKIVWSHDGWLSAQALESAAQRAH